MYHFFASESRVMRSHSVAPESSATRELFVYAALLFCACTFLAANSALSCSKRFLELACSWYVAFERHKVKETRSSRHMEATMAFIVGLPFIRK